MGFRYNSTSRNGRVPESALGGLVRATGFALSRGRSQSPSRLHAPPMRSPDERRRRDSGASVCVPESALAVLVRGTRLASSRGRSRSPSRLHAPPMRSPDERRRRDSGASVCVPVSALAVLVRATGPVAAIPSTRPVASPRLHAFTPSRLHGLHASPQRDLVTSVFHIHVLQSPHSHMPSQGDPR
jgi:hypothetical protein